MLCIVAGPRSRLKNFGFAGQSGLAIQDCKTKLKLEIDPRFFWKQQQTIIFHFLQISIQDIPLIFSFREVENSGIWSVAVLKKYVVCKSLEL